MITQEILNNLLLSGTLKEKITFNSLNNGKGVATIYKDAFPKKSSESGYILLNPGSSIGLYYSKTDVVYSCLCGAFESNGFIYSAGQSCYCSLNEGHNIKNVTDTITIIRYVK